MEETSIFQQAPSQNNAYDDDDDYSDESFVKLSDLPISKTSVQSEAKWDHVCSNIRDRNGPGALGPARVLTTPQTAGQH